MVEKVNTSAPGAGDEMMADQEIEGKPLGNAQSENVFEGHRVDY
jgi:hypothetical protein